MVIVIVGPTAVGKTKLSVELAKYFHGEVINADSTQIYKGLDIATAKVTEEEKQGVPHHLFDIMDMDDVYTVYDYQKDCRKCIEDILKRDHIPILVGGTGLYIKAALYDYQFEEGCLKEKYDDVPTEELYNQLKQLDFYTNIHPHNRQRIVRALNYCIEYHKPFSEKKKTEELLYDVVWIGLTTERSQLYNRIHHRVDVMVEQGLLEEALRIYQSGVRSKAVLTPIGYKELFPYFEKRESLQNCLEDIRKHSRHYAKRQYTWFQNQMNVKWFDVHFDCFESTVLEVIQYIQSKKTL